MEQLVGILTGTLALGITLLALPSTEDVRIVTAFAVFAYSFGDKLGTIVFARVRDELRERAGVKFLVNTIDEVTASLKSDSERILDWPAVDAAVTSCIESTNGSQDVRILLSQLGAEIRAWNKARRNFDLSTTDRDRVVQKLAQLRKLLRKE
jgi:hypothetical protein